MKALILAAGFGTRLKPLTDGRAKPALSIVGIPGFLYAVENLANTFPEIEFAMNYCHAPAHLLSIVQATGIPFHLSDETSGILGSAGCLAKLAKWIGSEPLLVSNGDSISFPNWEKMLEAHKKSGALMTLHLRSFSGSKEGYPSFEVEASGKINSIGPKSSSGVMFSGNYIIEPAAIKRLPASGPSEMRPLLMDALVAEGKAHAYLEDVAWFDAGTPETFAEAQFELAKACPQARELIELGMKEIKKDVWVPLNWTGKGLEFHAPCVLNGSEAEWSKISKSFGPKFVGLEPGKGVFKNEIVLGETRVALK